METHSTWLTILAVALPVIFALLVGGILWVLTATKASLQAKAQGSALAAVALRLSMLAEAIVRDLEVTLKPELAKATADGRLTADEFAKLKAIAVQRLKATLGDKGVEEVQGVLGIAAGAAVDSVNRHLSGVIEGAVVRVKADKVALSVGAPPPSFPSALTP